MANRTKRFNLQFNLEKEDEAIAAKILENMGRKKSSVLAKALLYLLQTNPDAIRSEKVFNYEEDKDLIFMGQLASIGVQERKKAEPKKKAKKPQNIEKKKKVKEPTQSPSSIPKKKKELLPQKEIGKDFSPINSQEESSLLEEMLEGLNAFF